MRSPSRRNWSSYTGSRQLALDRVRNPRDPLTCIHGKEVGQEHGARGDQRTTIHTVPDWQNDLPVLRVRNRGERAEPPGAATVARGSWGDTTAPNLLSLKPRSIVSSRLAPIANSCLVDPDAALSSLQFSGLNGRATFRPVFGGIADEHVIAVLGDCLSAAAATGRSRRRRCEKLYRLQLNFKAALATGPLQHSLLDRTFAKFGVELEHRRRLQPRARGGGPLRVRPPITSNILQKVEAAPWPYAPVDLLPIFFSALWARRRLGDVLPQGVRGRARLEFGSRLSSARTRLGRDPHRAHRVRRQAARARLLSRAPTSSASPSPSFMLAASIEGRSTILKPVADPARAPAFRREPQCARCDGGMAGGRLDRLQCARREEALRKPGCAWRTPPKTMKNLDAPAFALIDACSSASLELLQQNLTPHGILAASRTRPPRRGATRASSGATPRSARWRWRQRRADARAGGRGQPRRARRAAGRQRPDPEVRRPATAATPTSGTSAASTRRCGG